MPTIQQDRIASLIKAGLVALVEGVKAVPGVGSLVVAGVAGTGAYLQASIAAADLPAQAGDALQQMTDGYRDLLAVEAKKHPDDNTLEVALVATLDILTADGLSAQELVQDAALNAEQAAKLTLQRAASKVQALYDSEARALAQRLVGDYYRILLGHKDALDYVAVAALQTLLASLPDVETQLQPQLAHILANQATLLNRERVMAWRQARWPVRPYPPGHTLHPYILKPEYRLIRYEGRAQLEMRDELVAWAQSLGQEDTPPLGMRLYIGAGGAGKTRLLIEAGERLRSEGWAVYFWGTSAAPSDAPYLLDAPVPTLLILDYVAEREAMVQALLQQMAQQRQRPQPFALILLERTAPPWFHQLTHSLRDPTYVGLPELLALPTVEKRPRAIPAFGAEDERRALFATAVALFAQVIQNHEATAATSPPDLPRRPLYVLLLALLAATGEDVAHLDDENKILAATWNRERQLWRQKLAHAGLPATFLDDATDFIQEMLILRSLGRVLDQRWQLSPYLQAYFDEDDLQGNAAAIIKRLLCPQHDCALAAIAPDPLADDVIERRLGERIELLDLALPTPAEIDTDPAAAAGQTWQTLILLQRVASHPRHHAPQQVMGWADEMAEILKKRTEPGRDASAPMRFLSTLDEALPSPDRTLFLRPLVAAVWEAQLALLADTDRVARARLLNNLSVAYSTLGRQQQALAATEEAVKLYRDLAQAQPAAFRPDLAISLNNLGIRYSDLGRRQQALAATEEAVKLYRDLAPAQPTAFRPDLARSLNNLGIRYSALGQRQQALAATEEAVKLYRDLAQAQPAAFRPDLAGSLNNLGAMLSAPGRRQQALAATQEAVKLYRQLAQAQPAAFRPDLARSLNNLGIRYAALGRRQQALTATEEAVKLYRQLAQAQPAAFRPDLASSLNNLGDRLSEHDQQAEALLVYEEAVRLLAPFFRQLPQAFAPRMSYMVRDYIEACNRTGSEPDADLFGPLQETLAKLESE